MALGCKRLAWITNNKLEEIWLTQGHLVYRQGSHSLEKSLNFCTVVKTFLEFSSTLNVVAWKEFFMLFGCLRQNINHSSENLKVIYIKCSMFYAIII